MATHWAYVFGPRTGRRGHEQTVSGHQLQITHRTDTCGLPQCMPNSPERGCNACAGDRPGSATSRAVSTGLVHAWPCFLKPGSRAIFRLQIQQIQWSGETWPARPLRGHGPPSSSTLAMAATPVRPCANRDLRAAYSFKASAQSFRPRGGQRVSMTRPGRASARDARLWARRPSRSLSASRINRSRPCGKSI